METTLVVSDVHLGSYNSRATSLSALLQSRFDRLILNGDTIDSLNFRRFGSNEWALIDQLRTVASERELILIRGNHEGSPSPILPHRSRTLYGCGESAPVKGAATVAEKGRVSGFGPLDVLTRLLEVPLHEEYVLQVGSRRYLVLHGDRFDSTLNLTWIGDAADYCYNVVQYYSRPVARWLKRRVKRWGGVVHSVRQGATGYAEETGCDGVIAGHTHFADDASVNGIHYLNTGCWVDQPCTYVRVRGDQLTLHYWDGNAAEAIENRRVLVAEFARIRVPA